MKNLAYFVALPYRIEIRPIPANMGGGYEASVPRLGRYAVRGDGETIEEALHNLEEVKHERLTAYLEEGLTIPEPESDDDDYSGKFVVRIPKSLHRELSQRAKENDVSLNQYVASLLSAGVAREAHDSEWLELVREIRDKLSRIQEINDLRSGLPGVPLPTRPTKTASR